MKILDQAMKDVQLALEELKEDLLDKRQMNEVIQDDFILKNLSDAEDHIRRTL